MWDKSFRHWTSIAVVALLLHFSGGAWPMLLLYGIIGYGLMEIVPPACFGRSKNRILIGAQLLAIYLMMSQLVPQIAVYWPGEKSDTVIPFVLIAAGILGCRRKPERVAGVLMYGMILLSVPLLLAAGKTMKPEWIRPVDLKTSPWIVPILLFPFFVEKTTGRRQWNKGDLISILLAAVGWALVSGVLSPEVAKNTDHSFRIMTQSISLGRYSRFEAAGSLLITLGWYSYITLALYCTNELWSRLGISSRKTIWIQSAVLLAQLLIPVKITVEIIGGIMVIVCIWSIIDARGKTVKKDEKSA